MKRKIKDRPELQAKLILTQAQKEIRELGFCCDTGYELTKIHQGTPVLQTAWQNRKIK